MLKYFDIVLTYQERRNQIAYKNYLSLFITKLNYCSQIMEQCQQGVESFNLQDALAQAEDAMQEDAPSQASAISYLQPLEKEEIQCEQIDSTIYTKSGVIIQMCNTNASAHATVIGGIRLALEDIRKVPAYLQKYRTQIKKIAVRTLTRHLQESQCSVGLHETLSLEDYGMTFTIASLSQRGRQLNPQNRSEAPLFYCLLQGLLEPVILSANQDGSYQTGHIVNLYIHLLPAHHRRVVLARKSIAANELETAAEGPSNKKPRPAYEASPRPQVGYPPYPDNRGAYNERRQNYENTVNSRINQKVEEVVNKKLTTVSLASAFPQLPATKMPSWNKEDTDELPEN